MDLKIGFIRGIPVDEPRADEHAETAEADRVVFGNGYFREWILERLGCDRGDGAAKIYCMRRIQIGTRQAMHTPTVLAALRPQGDEPLDAGPDEFAAFFRSETIRWTEVARAAAMKS